MILERLEVKSKQGAIPAVALSPPDARGAALVIHSYGGSKEEVLGLASRIAELGLVAYAMDLGGHGQNPRRFNRGVVEEVEAVIAHLQRLGRVVAVGHSLGGRLALASAADYAFAISPALARAYGAATRNGLDDFRSYRVREASQAVNLDLLRSLPEWRPGPLPAAIAFGSRDVPEIIEACRAVAALGADVTEIPRAMHQDIIQLEATFEVLEKRLRAWFPRPVIEPPTGRGEVRHGTADGGRCLMPSKHLLT